MGCLFEGRLERVVDGILLGWLWDKNHPILTVFVDVFLDGIHVLSVAANEYRTDLEKAQKGRGACGFRAPLPPWALDGDEHDLTMKIVGTEDVIWSLKTKLSPSERYRNAQEYENFLSAKNNVFCRKLTGDSPLSGSVTAILGRNDWLFLNNDSNGLRHQLAGVVPVSESVLRAYFDIFTKRRTELSKLGATYVFAIAPTKELIYPEHLPHGYSVNQSAFPAHVIQEFLSSEGFPILDLKGPLLAAKKMGQVYHRTDTHWNDFGSLVAAELILSKVRMSIPQIPTINDGYFEQVARSNFMGDLAHKRKHFFFGGERGTVPCAEGAFTPTDFSETYNQYVPVQSKRTLNLEVADYLRVSSTRPTIVRSRDQSDLPKAVIFHDSFGATLVNFLSLAFARSVFLWRPELILDIVRREQPDVVIHIVADRFMLRVPVS